MSWLGQSYFYICAALAVLGALVTITNANPIRGAMGLMTTILAIAGLFLALHAQFLAAIQLIVYAGAVVVLFLFVIMLLGPSAQSPRDNRGRFVRFVGGGTFAAVSLGAMYLIIRGAPTPKQLGPLDVDFGGVDAFGRVLFSNGIVPFELSSALLMVAVIGAVAVARGKQGKQGDAGQPNASAPSADLGQEPSAGHKAEGLYP